MIKRRWIGFACAGLAVVLASACGDDDNGGPVDAGRSDATTDASARVDTGTDTGSADSVAPDAGDASVADASDAARSDASDAATAEAGDAAVVDAGDAGPCGAFGQACCTSGPQCADVTLSCVTNTCQRTIVVDMPGAGFTLNGSAARPALTLKSGITYKLNFVNSSSHPFIFTTNSTGGSTAGELTSAQLPGYVAGGACVSGCTSTTLTITPNVGLISSFFYQCEIHTGLGNSVTVIP